MFNTWIHLYYLCDVTVRLKKAYQESRILQKKQSFKVTLRNFLPRGSSKCICSRAPLLLSWSSSCPENSMSCLPSNSMYPETEGTSIYKTSTGTEAANRSCFRYTPFLQCPPLSPCFLGDANKPGIHLPSLEQMIHAVKTLIDYVFLTKDIKTQSILNAQHLKVKILKLFIKKTSFWYFSWSAAQQKQFSVFTFCSYLSGLHG